MFSYQQKEPASCFSTTTESLKFPLAELCRSCAAFPVHNSAVLRERTFGDVLENWKCLC